MLQPFHIDHPCDGIEKVRNGLFTLQRLVGRSICLAFDQIEDTYNTLVNAGAEGEVRRIQWATLLRGLCETPSFGLIFACQQSAWSPFASTMPQMLVQRMTAAGVQSLQPLTDPTATDLISERLRAAVWSRLPDSQPPPGEPCFPFTANDVRQFRISAETSLREFLQLAQCEFESRLRPTTTPPRPPRLRLTVAEPREVLSHEHTAILIRGKSLPPNVTVRFGTLEPVPAVCRQAAGEIDARTPTGLVGETVVAVTDADDPENTASLPLLFVEREVPRPYCEHVCRRRLRARREELQLSQQAVAAMIDSNQTRVSQLERGKWRAPDTVYAQLARCYDRPLAHFLPRADDAP